MRHDNGKHVILLLLQFLQSSKVCHDQVNLLVNELYKIAMFEIFLVFH